MFFAVIAAGPATASGCDDACKLAAAQSYIDSLTSHNADAVPFAPDATRVENGFNTGSSGEEIRNDLNTSPKYYLILGVEDTVKSVSGNVVTTSYTLDVGLLGIQLGTSHVDETFLISHGQIKTITATFDISLGTFAKKAAKISAG